MCTAIVLFHIVPGYPLVVGFNRDQRYGRLSTPPQIDTPKLAGDPNALQVLAPRDVPSGGTWLGLNDRGFTAAVIDYRPAQGSAVRSRGPLVLNLLRTHTDPIAAASALAQEEFRSYRPSTFLLANGDRGVVVGWHGRLGRWPITPGISVLTDQGLNARRSARTRHHMGTIFADFGDVEQATDVLQQALREHRSAERRCYTTCCHSATSGTVSSSVLAIGSSIRESFILHSEGAACQALYQRFNFHWTPTQ